MVIVISKAESPDPDWVAVQQVSNAGDEVTFPFHEAPDGKFMTRFELNVEAVKVLNGFTLLL